MWWLEVENFKYYCASVIKDDLCSVLFYVLWWSCHIMAMAVGIVAVTLRLHVWKQIEPTIIEIGRIWNWCINLVLNNSIQIPQSIEVHEYPLDTTFVSKTCPVIGECSVSAPYDDSAPHTMIVHHSNSMIVHLTRVIISAPSEYEALYSPMTVAAAV